MTSRIETFWNGQADSYARRKVSNQQAYEKKLQQIQDVLTPDMDVLEFGCGTGSTALHLAPWARHIHGTDISSRMIEIAQGKAQAAGITNVSFAQGDITGSNGDQRQFEVVMGHSILHLVDDRQQVIARAAAMTKPGGLFITSTSCLQDRLFWLKGPLALGHLVGWLPKVGFFTRESFLGDIRQAGFVIEDSWQPSPAQAMFLIARKPG